MLCASYLNLFVVCSAIRPCRRQLCFRFRMETYIKFPQYTRPPLSLGHRRVLVRTGSQCNVSPSWAEWLAGSVVRLILTLAVLIAYHLTAYHYDITRQPSRRRRRSRPRSGSSLPSVTPMSVSTATHHPMSSTSTPLSPVSLSQVGRPPSILTSEGHTTVESHSSAGDHRPLRSSRSRINAESFLPVDRGKASHPRPSRPPAARKTAPLPRQAFHRLIYRTRTSPRPLGLTGSAALSGEYLATTRSLEPRTRRLRPTQRESLHAT
ncbi:uncharacterized protein B0H18DRAFT_522785 [Fomitopsis serialis]|uniref:uncharacterized protein n=1 Tax=Fomitopsis serialis TaxID=139415 RepID=UPI00200778E0|nr:uncharacterized protein B0H18DRAFT_522785 [Neoantrodia serialis]KAH9922218.1 hypothetical protein B0H18DRAFT_522785 [Neoantrodia serialis]